jgi:thiosulfate reductase cytochrome b subunit
MDGVIYGLVTGRLRERMLPIRIDALVQTIRETLHFKIAHDDLTVYNAVQKLLYIVVILAGISQVVTGLLIWKPIQFSSAVAVLGGFQAVRVEHFVGMSVIVGFLMVHVALSLLVPQTLWAMLSGGSGFSNVAGSSEAVCRSAHSPAETSGWTSRNQNFAASS